MINGDTSVTSTPQEPTWAEGGDTKEATSMAQEPTWAEKGTRKWRPFDNFEAQEPTWAEGARTFGISVSPR